MSAADDRELSSREFANEIGQLVSRLSQEMEAHQLGLDGSASAVAERRRRVLVEQDFAFFAYTYFPHHIRGESSEFQAKFCERFPQLLNREGGCIEWWVAPRGECKSSLLTKIGPVWLAVQALLQRPEIRQVLGVKITPKFLDYALLLGAETKLPIKLLAVAKTELTCNAMLAMDFPEVCRATDCWKIGEIVTATGVKLEPFGAEQAIRGTFHGSSRPSVLFGDDIITDKEAKSPVERENRWNWVEKAVEYLGPPDGSVKFFGVGTILNKDDPISRAKATVGHLVHHFKAIVKWPKHMDLWDACAELMLNDDKRTEEAAAERGVTLEPASLPSYVFYLKHKKRMDKGAKVSWPQVRSLYQLMRARAKNKKAFGTEMQGDPRADEDKVFTDITFWVQTLQHWLWFGGCDPSLGKRDPSAILTGGFDVNTGTLHVVHAAIKHRRDTKLFRDLIAAQKEFGCQVWGFENNNAYDYMRKEFMRQSIQAEIPMPLHGVTATVGPEIRIDSLETFVSNGRIQFSNELRGLLDELDEWPEPQKHHHFDGLSALELLWHVASTRTQRLPSVAGRRRSGRGGVPWGNYGPGQ